MKATLIILLLTVLFGLDTVMTKTIAPNMNNNKLELKFKIKQERIKRTYGYFDAALTIKNISNDTLVIPTSIVDWIGCGDHSATIYIEIYYLNGDKYQSDAYHIDIDDFTIDTTHIYLKPGDSIIKEISKDRLEIYYGCPINKKGKYKIRAQFDPAGGIIGEWEPYYSNYDTIVVK